MKALHLKTYTERIYPYNEILYSYNVILTRLSFKNSETLYSETPHNVIWKLYTYKKSVPLKGQVFQILKPYKLCTLKDYHFFNDRLCIYRDKSTPVWGRWWQMRGRWWLKNHFLLKDKHSLQIGGYHTYMQSFNERKWVAG